MKLKGFLFGCVFLVSGAANAGTVWTPTDGDVDYIFSITAGNEIVLYDAGDFGGTALSIAPPVFNQIVFEEDGFGDWTATNDAGDSIDLGPTPNFELALILADGSIEMETSISQVGTDSYSVHFSEANTIQIDAKPVPVPAALWLFGSAIAGFSAFTRRKSAVAIPAMA